MNKLPETFVPEDILNILETLKKENRWNTTKEYNEHIRTIRPNVPRSTITRWTRAFLSGSAHSETPSWHVRHRSISGIVPEKFSAIKSGRIKEEREKWKYKGEIRYANVSDFHRPLGDGALLTLAMRVIKDFEPNIFPAFSDWLDMDRFSRHSKKPSTFSTRYEDDNDRNRFKELRTLSVETVELVRQHIPKDCTLINLWGNHENWLLRYLIDIHNSTEGGEDIIEYFIDDYFSLLESLDVLWVDGETNHWFPITKEFWVGHGHRSRNGSGKTALSYLTNIKYAASIAVGHTHRQEVVSVPLPYIGNRFCAVAGTLGQLQPNYSNKEFMGHNWGFQLIEHPFDGAKGSHVEDVRIYYKDGYYICKAYGKEYSEQATIEYDEFMDFSL